MSIGRLVFEPKVVCDACGRAFRASKRLRDEELASGGLRRHFDCPYCGTDVTVAMISKRGVALSKAIQELTLGRGVGVSERDARTLKRLREQLAREVTRG